MLPYFLLFAGLAAFSVWIKHPHVLPMATFWEKAFYQAHWVSGLGLLALLVLLSAMEELVFRGVLFGMISRSPLGDMATLAISTYLWAMPLQHAHIHGIAANFAVGASLGWTRLRSGSVKLPLLLHIVYNAAALALRLWWPGCQ